ncbi:MAG: ROK family protein [Christensenellales bacterium]|jgi:glucokinase
MYYLGIDLGGTHIACGVVDAQGSILAQAETPTRAERPYQEVIYDMGQCALAAIQKANVQQEEVLSIGIGIPGLANNDNGYVIFCTNLGWTDVPLRDELQKVINRPVYIDNDATVAGFAESIAGVSKGLSSSVFLTLGTGVGGAIIIDGKPWTGAHGVASEIGHLTLVVDGVPCTCGKSGCVERYCSATALIRMARETAQQNPDWLVLKRLGDDPSRITAKVVIDAAREGDGLALDVFNRFVKHLALTCNIVVSFLDPEMIVLGGGVSHAGDFLLEAVRRELPNYLMYKTLPYADIELAQLGNSAGIIGAAMVGKIYIEGA